MMTLTLKRLALVVVTVLPVMAYSSSGVRASQDGDVLTNSDVVRMLRAGLAETVVLEKIRTSKARFMLSPDDLIQLKIDGAPDAIVEAMLKRKHQLASSGTGALSSTAGLAPIPIVTTYPARKTKDGYRLDRVQKNLSEPTFTALAERYKEFMADQFAKMTPEQFGLLAGHLLFEKFMIIRDRDNGQKLFTYGRIVMRLNEKAEPVTEFLAGTRSSAVWENRITGRTVSLQIIGDAITFTQQEGSPD